MKIIIDTNIIHRDYHLRGKHILTLSEAAMKLGYEVCIPEVVVDEIENQYKAELSSSYNKYCKDVDELDSLLPDSVKTVVTDKMVTSRLSKFRGQYIAELYSKHVRILPYPTTNHKFLVEKELSQKKPFKDSKKGYRDALIWETVKSELIPVKDLVDQCQILLLTNNTNDFAKGNELHPDLKRELEDLGYSDEVVKLTTDCQVFFQDIIYPQFEELDNIKTAFNTKGAFNRLSIKDNFAPMFDTQFVEMLIDEVDDFGINAYLPSYCESPYVESCYEPEINVESVIRLEDGTVMMGCSIVVKAEISYYLERSNLMESVEDIHPHILNNCHNDRYLEAANLVEVKATVNYRVSKSITKVLTTEVSTSSISIVPYENL